MYIDTAGCELFEVGGDGDSKYNEGEADIVKKYVSLLTAAGLHDRGMAVITPYRFMIPGCCFFIVCAQLIGTLSVRKLSDSSLACVCNIPRWKSALSFSLSLMYFEHRHLSTPHTPVGRLPRPREGGYHLFDGTK